MVYDFWFVSSSNAGKNDIVEEKFKVVKDILDEVKA